MRTDTDRSADRVEWDDATPADLGYRMPAEWAPHASTWISWPHNRETWPEPRLEGVERAMAEVVRVLSGGETVRINVLDPAHERHVRGLLGQLGRSDRVVYHRIPTNDAWCRDHGATFLVRDVDTAPLAAIGWTFNAWGEKYRPYDRDAAVAGRMAEALGIPSFQPDLVAEGGALEVDGEGTLLTTASCLSNPNRNPDRSQYEIEQTLRSHLGLREVHWLEAVELAGDDTDGHVDNLVRFGPNRMLFLVTEDDPSDTNYRPLRRLGEQVERIARESGRTIRTLPMPDPVVLDGLRLPASYANFYVGNDLVLVPQFDDAADGEACDRIGEGFRDRDAVGIPAREILFGLGSLHCLTQQVPRVDRT